MSNVLNYILAISYNLIAGENKVVCKWSIKLGSENSLASFTTLRVIVC